MPIQVAITDDHPLAIHGINLMISSYPHIVVTDTYSSANDLLKGLEKRQPDVLLLDLLLPGQSGRDLAPVILQKYPDIRIIILTSLDAPAMVKHMIQAGCLGYLLKGTDQETLKLAIEQVYEGKEFIEPDLKEYLLQQMLKTKKQNPVSFPVVLTKREKEILHLVLEGCTTQEIADKLFISARTAETHRLSLLKKLDAKNTASLVMKAIQLGFIEI